MASIERSKPSTTAGMTHAAEVLSELLTERFSCRAYRPEPVPHDVIETMLAISQNAASWCNSQPWQIHVTEGAATERLREAMFARASADMAAGAMSAESDLPFPQNYAGVYKDRQREVGWQLYEAVGVTYGDRVGSARQMLENFRLFGAPHALVITTEKSIGTYGVLDCGSYLGSLLLAAQSLGIGMITQAAFANYCPLLREFFVIPDTRDIVCGASFGWPDMDHPANSFRSRRAELTDVVTMAGPVGGDTGTAGLRLPTVPASYRRPDEDRGNHFSRHYTPYVWFAQVARRFPDRVALTGPEGSLAYRQLDDMTRAFARGLVRSGMAPGEAIGVACGNRWELAPLFLACSAVGVVFTAFNPMLTGHELAYQIGELRPRMLIADGHTRLEDLLDADDGEMVEPTTAEWGPLMVRFSSGTTGKPKAMVSSQRAQVENYRHVMAMLDMRADDVHLVTGPLSHAALHAGLPQLLVGGRIAMMGRFDKACFWDDCAEHGATNALMVPTMLSGALDYPGEAPSLRRLMSTAATLALPLKQRLAERFPHVGLVEAYGSSEFGYVAALMPDEQQVRPRSVGRPLPGQDVAIFDDDGRPCAAGDIGMIHVRSPELVTRHFGSVLPEPTIAESRGDGWLTSGDLGYLDSEGYLFISDRRADLIISGGLNVYPAEVEAVLLEVPGMREVAVVGIPDSHWGSRVVAYVDADADVANILAHCEGRLAKYKIPRAVHKVGPLPRTSSGKTSRMLTRIKAERGEFPS